MGSYSCASPKQVRVAVAGATGYAGAELLRLLAGHPAVVLVAATSQRDAGKRLAEVHPNLACTDLELSSLDPAALAAAAEIVFLTLPHGTSAPVVRVLVEAGLRVIDLGADFRFRDARLYERWYGRHEAPELLEQAVYGLTEYYRDEIAAARLVANPGCYPTGALLALLPLAGLIRGPVIVDAKSGSSGAGRAAATEQLFAEVSENVRPYAVGKHRHQPEIEARLSEGAGRDLAVLFVPHLLPMTRGLLSACYMELSEPAATDGAFEQAYGGEPFVRLLGEGGLPEPRNVRGTNRVEIGWVTDSASGRLAVFSAIDNLGKGAAGQAVQNMNCMLGLAEETGLDQIPALP